MPVAVLNNVATQDGYVDALTVNFPRGRTAFSLNVFNAAIYYRLLWLPRDGQQRDPTSEAGEHFLAPSLSTFRDVIGEGGTPDNLFGGIMIRSAIAGTPAQVTVA